MPRNNLLSKKKKSHAPKCKLRLQWPNYKTAQLFSIPLATLHRRVHGLGETIGSG